jgi:hypothetical protein
LDVNWTGDPVERKSNAGYMFNGAHFPITWKSRRLSTITFSDTESEYIGLVHCI